MMGQLRIVKEEAKTTKILNVKIPSLTVAKESRAHKRRNYAIYELLFSCAPSGARF